MMENIQKIPAIKILNKGETYAINRAADQQGPNKPKSEVQDCSNTKEIEMEIIQEDDVKSNINKDLPQHNESWKTVTPSKKRKINTDTNDRRGRVLCVDTTA